MVEYLAWSEKEIQQGFKEQSQYFNSEKFTTGNPSQYFNSEKFTTAPEKSLISYPFHLITEVFQAGKVYGSKVVETVKNIVSYPYEKIVDRMTAEKPTGIIKDTWSWDSLLKPPYIYFILGISGLWIYSVFKKR